MNIKFPSSREELKVSTIFHKIESTTPYEIWINTDISEKELAEYVAYIKLKYIPSNITHTMIYIENNGFVSLSYFYKDANFKRIRRITGYLVGDVSRFNNAKHAEVNDRVKHGA